MDREIRYTILHMKICLEFLELAWENNELKEIVSAKVTYILANQHNCYIIPWCEFLECIFNLFHSCFWERPKFSYEQMAERMYTLSMKEMRTI